jgi:hypothetical protein
MQLPASASRASRNVFMTEKSWEYSDEITTSENPEIKQSRYISQKSSAQQRL